MEKYLRLLNPKTTNFDSVGGGSYGSLTAQDICAAISYAELTPVQNILLRLYISQVKDLVVMREATKMILLLRKSKEIVAGTVLHESALYIALVEIFTCPADYKPSERNRAAIGQVSRMQIQRNLSTMINYYREEIKDELDIIEVKIRNQLSK